MTLSTTINKASYSGDGNTTTFNYNFKIFTNSDLKVIIRSASGTETLKTITTHYTVSGAGSNSGGSVTFTGGNIPTNTETVILQRVVPLTQTHDYVENDPFPAESHEQGLDRLTMHVQQLQEEVDRSIKASVSNTITSTEFTNDATDRANKLFAFDSAGNINIATTIGSNTGNWATATAYAERDIVKDTSTNNIFQCKTAHTSSGSQPLTTNTDSAKWDLLVDAESATTSATNASNSATASANSATASANSATQSATSATNASNSATASAGSATTASNHVTTASGHATDADEHKQTAQRWASLTGSTVTDVDTGVDSGEYSAKHYAQQTASTYDDFDDRYLGPKSSAPTQDNDGDSLQTGSLYFNTSTNDLYVWNGSAWEQASFSAGGFMSQSNNLSDVADASTSRTNLGLGTSAVLNVGTSANNIPQLDGNAKLPAVDGSQLTGLASGTDAIPMVVATGSDAISVGDVVTRESNGETKKIKQVTATTNYSLTARDVQNAISSGYASADYTKNVGCLGMEGRYLHAWWNGNNVWLTGYSHSGSGTWAKGSEVNTNRDHDNNSYARMKMSYVPTLNASAGGTFLLQIHDQQTTMCGNYCGRAGYLRILAVTVDSSGTVTNHGQLFDIGAKLGENSNHASSIIYGDHVVISAGNETCELVGAYASTWEYWGVSATDGIGSITITHNGSSYASTGHGKQSLGLTDYSFTHTSMMVEYDHTNEVIVCGQVQGSQTSFRSFKKSSGTYNWSNTGSWTDSNLGLSSSYRYQPNRLGSASGEGYVFFGRADSSNINIRGFQMSSGGGVSGNFDIYSGSGFGNPRVCDVQYSFINNKIYLAEEGATSTYGNNGYVRSYSLSGTTVTAEDTVNASASPTNVFGQSFSIPFDKFSTGFTDVNQVRYFGIYATNTNSGNNSMQYKSGVYDGAVTATTTNKLLAFGFAQKAGSVGDTISILPFDSESIEQNQTSLTHGTKYYVTDTGSLGTSAGTDNPLVGQAINTTFLRLPSKDISGGGASQDTSKIFCGAVDLKNDSGVQSNFTLSKPANLNAEDIRAYIIEYYGIMTSTGTGDYYVLQMKPYNSGSSVMNSTFYGGGFYYGGGSDGSYNTNMSTYLNIAYQGGTTIQGASSSTRASNSIMYSPSWSGVCLYENNINQASIDYWSIVRDGTSNNSIRKEWYTGGANNNQTTSNYADAFYFEPRTGTWSEGVVSLYAITK